MNLAFLLVATSMMAISLGWIGDAKSMNPSVFNMVDRAMFMQNAGEPKPAGTTTTSTATKAPGQDDLMWLVYVAAAIFVVAAIMIVLIICCVARRQKKGSDVAGQTMRNTTMATTLNTTNAMPQMEAGLWAAKTGMIDQTKLATTKTVAPTITSTAVTNKSAAKSVTKTSISTK